MGRERRGPHLRADVRRYAGSVVWRAAGRLFDGRDGGDALVVEHNGDVYSCDHFVYPEYLLGNIRETGRWRIFYRSKKRAVTFGLAKRNALPAECLRCKYYFACRGRMPETPLRDGFGRLPQELTLRRAESLFPTRGTLHGLHARPAVEAAVPGLGHPLCPQAQGLMLALSLLPTRRLPMLLKRRFPQSGKRLLCRAAPVSRVLSPSGPRVSVIYLRRQSPAASSNLPPASDEQPFIAGIHGLATHGTYGRMTSLPPAVGSYPAPFTLTDRKFQISAPHAFGPSHSIRRLYRRLFSAYAPHDLTAIKSLACVVLCCPDFPPGLGRQRQSGPALQR